MRVLGKGKSSLSKKSPLGAVVGMMPEPGEGLEQKALRALAAGASPSAFAVPFSYAILHIYAQEVESSVRLTGKQLILVIYSS